MSRGNIKRKGSQEKEKKKRWQKKGERILTDIKYENGSRDGVNRASELSRGPRARDVKGPDQEKMETSEQDVKRKMCRDNEVAPERVHEKGMSREKDVKRKSFQENEMSRKLKQTTALANRGSGFVPIGFPFSL